MIDKLKNQILQDGLHDAFSDELSLLENLAAETGLGSRNLAQTAEFLARAGGMLDRMRAIYNEQKKLCKNKS